MKEKPWFLLFNDFFITFIYENWWKCTVPLKSNKQKTLKEKHFFFVGILSATDEKIRIRGSGSDPYQNVTDPQHRRLRSASVFFSVSDPVSVYLYTEPVPDSPPTHCFFLSKFLHFDVFFGRDPESGIRHGKFRSGINIPGSATLQVGRLYLSILCSSI